MWQLPQKFGLVSDSWITTAEAEAAPMMTKSATLAKTLTFSQLRLFLFCPAGFAASVVSSWFLGFLLNIQNFPAATMHQSQAL
jgi:hypothetical protein